jgi:hypothetical protein
MPIVVPVAACDPHRNRNRVPPPRRRPHALKRIHALSGWRRHQHTTVQQCHPDLKTRFYGSRRFTEWLNKLGHGVNRKHVQRLMLLMGIEAIYQKPNISKPAPVRWTPGLGAMISTSVTSSAFVLVRFGVMIWA